VERITVPGERSSEKYSARYAAGVPIPPPLKATLDKLAGELRIAALDA
jgi:LDH2 family malate/lactate/ureidoglycolate dehydrogenase